MRVLPEALQFGKLRYSPELAEFIIFYDLIPRNSVSK